MAKHSKKTRREISRPNWPNLHSDMLDLILDRLCFIDMLRFRAVCTSWRSIAKTHISSSSLPLYSSNLQPPYLLLPQGYVDDDDQDGLDHSRCFFNLADKTFIELNNMPKALSQSRCVGSSQGWLLFLDENNTPRILNPFLDVSVRPYFHHMLSFITKAVLWKDPIVSDNNYGIVAIYGFNFQSKLAYSKCGDSNWFELAGSHETYCDIICCRDYVYALADVGSVEAWDFNCSIPRKIMDIEAYFPEERVEFEKSLNDLYSSQFYLVESLGELLLVIRYIGEFVGYDGEVVGEADFDDGLIYPYMTKFFHVYKLDFKKKKWEKMGSLRDRMLFLGGNQSISLSTQNFSEYEENSIYFTDDSWDRMDEHYEYGGHDMGIFNLKDDCVKQITGIEDLQKFQPPPFWVVPTNSVQWQP
ncbi:unnamed protein product [Camellia sinensis]